MAHLSEASVWSSDAPPSEVSSDEAPRAVLYRSYPTRWTPEVLGLEPRPNRRLDNFLAFRRFVRPWPYEHTLSLGFARYLVAVLARGWPISLAQRTVAFLVIGQQ